MAIDIVIPSVGESVTSGVLSRWLKASGDAVAKDDIVLELETDKVTLEVRAPEAGVLTRRAKEGDTVPVGGVVGSIDPSAAAAAAPAAKAAPAAAKAESRPEPGAATAAAVATAAPAIKAAEPKPINGEVRATPLARKVAAEHNVDLSKVPATGAGHRVREQDVVGYVESQRPPVVSGGGAVAAGERGVKRERMTPLRQRVASRLVEAQHTAAMLTTFNECDMSGVMGLRKSYKEEFEKKHGIGLGFMGFFVKAVVSALRAFPAVNSYIVQDADGQLMIESHEYCDIAVAVSTPKGLVVPVLRGCESLSVAQIENGIKDLATRARDGKLSLEEMQGGTFTITNGGVFGSLMSTPILNPPQSGILGMHTIKNRPVEDPANPGQIVLRPMMYLALSYDHRIIDGAQAVQFLVRIKQAIEDPARLVLDI
ncbi:MAG: 2-oxoglutarate dehydrogenase complex dihydrolipoyllysine-residue succinyltransferase [Phycisphaerales bacterium]|nr:2-oxoglutarate dehydrogenase complex dihydrolipoyllysine-residue succinyltransferase [Phycisphaerales bacterium]